METATLLIFYVGISLGLKDVWEQSTEDPYNVWTGIFNEMYTIPSMAKCDL